MKRKLLLVLAMVLAVSLCALALSACGHEHTLGTWQSDESTHWQQCEECGEKLAVSAHAWNNGEVTQQATCTEEGTKTFTCAVCNATKTESMLATGHTSSDWIVDVAATCTTNGSRHAECTVCQEVLDEESIAATGHTPAIDKAVEPTCTQNGLTEGSHCSVCNAVIIAQQEVLSSHSWNEGEITIEPTCTAGSTKILTCMVCYATRTEHLFALRHNASPEWYSNENEHWRICTMCNNKIDESEHFGMKTCEICGELIPTKGLAYEIVENQAEVVGIGTATDQDIVIAATYQGYPVTNIRDFAFYECDEITSVVIPNSVVSVGNGSFYKCGNLQFNQYDNALYLGNSDNPYLALMEASDILISSCEIHSNTKIISGRAFYSCINLVDIVIPTSVISIGYAAFGYCSELESIVVELGNNVFHSSGNCVIETASKTLIVGCKNSVIPSDGSVISIGNSAFQKCDNLTSIVIPENITSIGYAAFLLCSNLANVKIPNSVTTIGDHAFRGCSSLASVTIGNSVTTIGDHAFASCISLTSIEIPSRVGSIGDFAFFNCSSLTSMVISSSVTSIGQQAICYCSNLISIVIPNSVASMEAWVFYDCGNLTDIYCEATSQPSGWDADWYVGCSATVHWGYEG
ncbi:MAG: leucine-rich repeat protein [Candidatus Fimimonas sp.]